MIWVIGDIHGMFDPLKLLMTRITELHHGGDDLWKVEKIIFIGDYIDYGPSSKEVIDYLLDLPFETVFLMGNHDDLLLQFVKDSDLFKSYGNVWFRGSGGQTTVMSFDPKARCTDVGDRFSREAFDLPPRYLDFFENLKLSHTESMKDYRFVFCHAFFNRQFPLEEQLAIRNYDEFHDWRRANDIWIEGTFLWNREEPTEHFGDFILIHGHVPTPFLANDWKDLHGFDGETALPFLKFKSRAEGSPEHEEMGEIEPFKAYQFHGWTGSKEELIAVNTDTGAVFGHRLTALGLSYDRLIEDRFMVIQVPSGQGYRRGGEIEIFSLKFSR